MFPKSFLTTLILALAVAANPVFIKTSPVTLPIARHLNFTGSATILQKDQARAASLRDRADNNRSQNRRAVVNEAVTNVAEVYSASIGVGSPATQYDLLIDTGSSNTWIGATKSYVKTSTSTQTSNKVSVTYGSGSFSGTEYTDTVTITTGLVIKAQSIGVASKSSGFDGFDGILGIGPVDLTKGTLSPATTTLIPTVTDNLFSQGTITSDEIGISFNPTTSESVVNGELTWGGVDTSKYTGSIGYTSLTTTSPASAYWGINESITYGSSKTTILSSTAGIVDTGTTLILLATNAITKYKSATGAVDDSATGLLRITSAQYASLQSLFFNIGGVSYELSANAQIWPRSLNTAIGGTSSNIYLVVADLGSTSGQGLDFINGYTFLERYYSVFDTTNKRVGFATTANTFATTN